MKGRKKIITGLIASVCMLGIIWSSAAFAFPNEPIGFRGNKWGTKVKDLTFKATKVESLEEIKVDFYNVSANNVFKVMIVTLDSRLVAVITLITDPKGVEAFAKALVKLYGIPTSHTGDTVVWVGETSTIEFSPLEEIIIIGSAAGMQGLEVLLEWYATNVKKQAI